METNIEPIVPFRQELIVPPKGKTMEPMVTKRKQSTYKQFSERLNIACDFHGTTKRGRSAEVGGLVGVGYKGASKWLAGDGMPDMGHASDLAVQLEVSFEWLMTGRGPMRLGPALLAGDEKGKYKEHGATALSKDAQALVDKYDRLDHKQKSHVQAV